MSNLLTEKVVDQIILVQKVLVALAELLQALDLAGHRILPLIGRLRLVHLNQELPVHPEQLEKDNSKKNNYYESKDTFCNIIPM